MIDVIIADQRSHLSFNEQAGSRGCTAPGSTRRTVCSEPRLRHEGTPVRSCTRAHGVQESHDEQALSMFEAYPVDLW